jgi:isoleucyl-tRNA synthetase
VVTNGWTLDEQGRTMSKSRGTGISPREITETDGADVLRLWVGSVDYFEDVRFGPNILDQVRVMYRQFRNTLRWGLGNLYDFDPVLNLVPLDKMREIDRFALHRLADLVRDSIAAYEGYEFHRFLHAAHQFCAADLSAFYYDVLKDTLYADAADSPSRRSAQTALFEITSSLARMLSPILSFTSEEVWQKLRMPQKPLSVELAAFPALRPEHLDAELAERWQELLAIRSDVNKAIEEARQSKAIGKPLEARVSIAADPHDFKLLNGYLEDLPALFLVSQVELKENADATAYTVTPAIGAKCARCWLVRSCLESAMQLCDRCLSVVKAETRPNVAPAGREGRR